MTASNDMEIGTLAQTAFEAYRHASGNMESQWELIPQHERDAWEHVAGQAILQLDREDIECVKAPTLALDMYEAYKRGQASPPEPFTNLPLEDQLHWEAVGRHLFNLIDSDGSAKLSDHEPRWRAWVENQLQRRRN